MPDYLTSRLFYTACIPCVFKHQLHKFVILFGACLDVIRDQVILEESAPYHFVSLTATPAVAPVDNSNLGTT